MRNLITDVPGLTVGHAHDARLASGVTTVVFDTPAVASVSIQGGAPGVRDTALLEPEMTVETVDALVLSGGSAFGLDSMGGVQAALREKGRGFAVGRVRIPIVPGAILFDLANGGDKDWARMPPYWDLGYASAEAAGPVFALGTAGAGFGATTADLKGGIGSASATTPAGFLVGALVAMNAIGQTTVGDGPHFWAAPYERDGEFGGLGLPTPWPVLWAASPQRRPARKHHDRHRRDRCGAHQGAMQTARHHGPRRHGPRHPAEPCAARRRPRVRGGNRASRRCADASRPHRDRGHGGGLRIARNCPRRVRSHSPAVSRRAARLEDALPGLSSGAARFFADLHAVGIEGEVALDPGHGIVGGLIGPDRIRAR